MSRPQQASANQVNRAVARASGRRRSPYTHTRREEVALMRRIGACPTCRRRKVRCHHAVQNRRDDTGIVPMLCYQAMPEANVAYMVGSDQSSILYREGNPNAQDLNAANLHAWDWDSHHFSDNFNESTLSAVSWTDAARPPPTTATLQIDLLSDTWQNTVATGSQMSSMCSHDWWNLGLASSQGGDMSSFESAHVHHTTASTLGQEVDFHGGINFDDNAGLDDNIAFSDNMNSMPTPIPWEFNESEANMHTGVTWWGHDVSSLTQQ